MHLLLQINSEMASLLRVYRALVDKHPYKVQIMTAGVICSMGDVATQLVEKRYNKQHELSVKRTAVMTAMGFTIFGPVCSVSMRLLHLYNFRVLPSVLVDQLVTSPIVHSLFLTCHPLLSGTSWEDVKTGWFARWRQIQLSAWMVWFPVQFVNFCFLPYQFRVFYTQMVALLWNMYLSYRANNS